MSNLNEKLAAITSQKSSGWLKKAQERRNNQHWLKHSAQLAVNVLAAIDNKPGMTQKKLA